MEKIISRFELSRSYVMMKKIDLKDESQIKAYFVFDLNSIVVQLIRRPKWWEHQNKPITKDGRDPDS